MTTFQVLPHPSKMSIPTTRYGWTMVQKVLSYLRAPCFLFIIALCSDRSRCHLRTSMLEPFWYPTSPLYMRYFWLKLYFVILVPGTYWLRELRVPIFVLRMSIPCTSSFRFALRSPFCVAIHVPLRNCGFFASSIFRICGVLFLESAELYLFSIIWLNRFSIRSPHPLPN